MTENKFINHKISISTIEDKSLYQNIHMDALEWYLLSIGWKKYENNPNPDMEIFIKDSVFNKQKYKIEFLKADVNKLEVKKIIDIIKKVATVEGKSELWILFQIINGAEMYYGKKINA